MDLVGVNRARKLRRDADEAKVSGAEYSQRLRQRSAPRPRPGTPQPAHRVLLLTRSALRAPRFAKMHGTAKWAQAGAGRRAAAWQDDEDSGDDGAGSGSEVGSHSGRDGDDGDDGDDLGAVLRSNAPLLGDGAQGGVGSPHPKGRLNIQRVRNLNQAAPSKAVVRSLEFHRSGQLALTAGLDKTLRLFQVRTSRPRAAPPPVARAPYLTPSGAPRWTGSTIPRCRAFTSRTRPSPAPPSPRAAARGTRSFAQAGASTSTSTTWAAARRPRFLASRVSCAGGGGAGCRAASRRSRPHSPLHLPAQAVRTAPWSRWWPRPAAISSAFWVSRGAHLFPLFPARPAHRDPRVAAQATTATSSSCPPSRGGGSPTSA